MSGNGQTYTTQGAGFKHTLTVVLQYQFQSPAIVDGLTTSWKLAYGTGIVPACAATSTGTAVGNQFTFATINFRAHQDVATVSVVITGLAASTAYWFEYQVTDSSIDSWVYSLPSLTVTEA
jgi:hypothetical protein